MQLIVVQKMAGEDLVFSVNGEKFQVLSVDPSTTLLEFLRSNTRFKSLKLSCGQCTHTHTLSLSNFSVNIDIISCFYLVYIHFSLWISNPHNSKTQNLLQYTWLLLQQRSLLLEIFVAAPVIVPLLMLVRLLLPMSI